jgi:hypothetical protein
MATVKRPICAPDGVGMVRGMDRLLNRVYGANMPHGGALAIHGPTWSRRGDTTVRA